MAAGIHHESAPGEAGSIHYPDARDAPVLLQLLERLFCIEDSCGGGSLDPDLAAVHLKHIAFFGYARSLVYGADYVVLDFTAAFVDLYECRFGDDAVYGDGKDGE